MTRMTQAQQDDYAALTATHNEAVVADIKASIAALGALASELKIGSSEDAALRDKILEAKRSFDVQWKVHVAPLLPASPEA